MKNDVFLKVEAVLAKKGSKACFKWLVDKFRNEKKYAELFEAMLMKKRYELDLPLLPSGPLNLHERLVVVFLPKGISQEPGLTIALLAKPKQSMKLLINLMQVMIKKE